MANLKPPWFGRLRRGLWIAGLAWMGLAFACVRGESPVPASPSESASMKRIRQIFARVPETLAKNHKVFAVSEGAVLGFGAGEAYPQIWLRDSAWIVPAAAAYYEAPTLTSWLDLHLSVARKNGRLRDWVAAASPDTFREWAPQVTVVGSMAVDTNSNESDQEPSAALAYCRAREMLGTGASMDDAADAALSRVSRLIKAIDALVRDRTDPKTGLVWSGLTADWGDVSPLYPDQRAIYLDAKTPRTLALYSNVMVYAALDCLAGLEGPAERKQRLATRAERLRDRIRTAFWMRDRGYFRIRIPFDRTPSEAFGAEEDERFALGGNALAALFGVADDDQAKAIFATAERLRADFNYSTISTTLIPPYAAGAFQHPAMREPFEYQNGGQWDWFGAPLVQAEFQRGLSAQARVHLDQMVARTLRAGAGIHEWYAQDGTPKGSGAYAAAAAALHSAIVRGLLGVSPSPDGYRVAIRTRETLLPFEVPNRAASERLVLSQVVTKAAIEVKVEGKARVAEICTLWPSPARPGEATVGGSSKTPNVRRVGVDTLVCADVQAASLPIQVRFALRPS